MELHWQGDCALPNSFDLFHIHDWAAQGTRDGSWKFSISQSSICDFLPKSSTDLLPWLQLCCPNWSDRTRDLEWLVSAFHECSLPFDALSMLQRSGILVANKGGLWRAVKALLPSPPVAKHIVSPRPCHTPFWTLFISNVRDSWSFQWNREFYKKTLEKIFQESNIDRNS